jgi:hypothetical protein
MTHAEIVKKLIGNIHPAGDASKDDKRFDNLKEMCDLVSDLVREINEVSKNKDRYEQSMKEAGQYADKFLINILDNL